MTREYAKGLSEGRKLLALNKYQQADLAEIRSLMARFTGNRSWRAMSDVDTVRQLISERLRELRILRDGQMKARIEYDNAIEGLESGDPSTGEQI